jgi:NAD-dependent protein deacetylases, SIR2 family
MDCYEERIEAARLALSRADRVIIGAGAGLSAAAGLDYSGPRFTDNFADFIEKYGLSDMYSASFYPFGTPEELWAHWARHIEVNRFAQPATPLYRELLDLVQGREYFVITTNVESQFAKAGFPDDRIFEVQGNYAYLQCAKACHDKLYYNEELIARMLASTRDCSIPHDLVPVCPVCGGNMDVNLRHNEHFVQDKAWHAASERYECFMAKARESRLVMLELGVGFNTPGIIRYPFENLAYRNKHSRLIRLNRDEPLGFAETLKETIPFDEEMGKVLRDFSQGNVLTAN